MYLDFKRLDLNKRVGLADFFIARHDIQRFVGVNFFHLLREKHRAGWKIS